MPTNLYEIDGDTLRFHFHPGQKRAMRSTRRFVFVLAGTQSGKTSFGPWWLAREINRTARAEGGNDYIAATASYDLFKLKMLPTLRETFEEVLPCNDNPECRLPAGRYWSGDRIIELSDPYTGRFWATRADDRMWGRIILRSAESGGGLESATAQAAWLDECGQDSFTMETMEAVYRRLSLSQGRILGTTTPYNLGYLKQIFDQWRDGDPSIEIIQFQSLLNPAFPREEFERAQATMAGWRFQMFYRGEFGKPAGLIYDCFDEDQHVINDFPIPSHFPRFVGLDFGGTNTALVWVAEDVDRGRYIVYRESLEGSKSTPEHAAAALENARNENVALWMGGSPSETQQRMDWNEAGVPVIQPYVPDVESGIDRVYALFRTKRLYVFRSCRGVRDEIGSYKRELDKSGQPTEKIAEKRKYHRLDALRYIGTGLTSGAVGYAPNPWA